MSKKTQDAEENENKNEGFSEEERAAMKERARELKSEARANKKKEEGEQDLLAKIAEMEEPDRTMAGRIHELVTAAQPDLWPRTWYGMPAYAKDGKVICFFQSGQKFKTRYCTLGFSDSAGLDDGNMWPSAYALAKLTAAEEVRILELLEKALR